MRVCVQGAHVTVNARSEDDVEPNVILDKVSKAVGVNYSFHREPGNRSSQSETLRPVRSVYQKISAEEEIKRSNKDQFWEQAENEEKHRRLQARRRAEDERQRLEDERTQQEARDSAKRESRQRERHQVIEQQRQYEKKLEEEIQERQQEQEAAAIISQRSINPRDLFRQKERTSEKFTNGLRSSTKAPGRLRSPFISLQPASSNSPAPKTSHNPPAPPAAFTAAVSAPPQPEQGPEPFSDEPLGPEQDEESDEWQDSDEEDLYGSEEENLHEEDPTDVQKEEWPAGTEGRGLSVRVLYDYQAEDESEISINPGDIITDVEMLEEGWWRGLGPEGRYGMFPANYVEVI